MLFSPINIQLTRKWKLHCNTCCQTRLVAQICLMLCLERLFFCRFYSIIIICCFHNYMVITMYIYIYIYTVKNFFFSLCFFSCRSLGPWQHARCVWVINITDVGSPLYLVLILRLKCTITTGLGSTITLLRATVRVSPLGQESKYKYICNKKK